jgi:hypothetical protein
VRETQAVRAASTFSRKGGRDSLYSPFFQVRDRQIFRTVFNSTILG